jgi:hypothetical protein
MHPMALELLAAQPTTDGTVRVTLALDGALRTLEGSLEEIGSLSEAMKEVSVLAGAAPDEQEWLTAVRVGGDTVRLGIGEGGSVRFRVVAGG